METNKASLLMGMILSLAVFAADSGRGVSVVPVSATAPSGNAGLFVGVNKFIKDPTLRTLEFAVNDAVAQAHLFVIELKLLPPANVYLALSGDVSGEAATAQLKALTAAGVHRAEAIKPDILNCLLLVKAAARDSSDLLMVSISSHGFEERRVAYAMPSDGLSGALEDTGLDLTRLQEKMDTSKAGKRLLLIDACREKPTTDTRSVGEGMSSAFRSALAATKGHMMLASCSIGQVSVENPQLQQGVFTYFLLKGLRGEAPADARGFITLGAVKKYVAQAVPDWVVHNRPGVDRTKAQSPWFEGEGVADEIPLAVDSGIKTRQETFKADVEKTIKALTAKIGTGEFNGALYDRVVAALKQAQDNDAGRKLLVNSKDFTDGKLGEETFVAYVEKFVVGKAPPVSFKQQLAEALRDLQARVEPAGPIPRDIYDDLVKGAAEMPETVVPDSQGQAMFAALRQAAQSDEAARAFVAKMKAARMQASRVMALNNLRQICIALSTYELDHGTYPTNLNVLVGKYLENDKLFTDPLSGQRIVYLQPNAPASTTIVAYTPTDVEGREVLFGDGHVSHMSAQEFQTALATQRSMQRETRQSVSPSVAAVFDQIPGGHAGLFVGVNHFDLDKSVRPAAFAVNDAVAQAYLLSVELKLLRPSNCHLALSDDPTTELLRKQLEELTRLGAKRVPAAKTRILAELRAVSDAGQGVGDLTIVSFCSCGFEESGYAYVMPSDGLRSDLKNTAVSLQTVEHTLATSKAGKRLLLVDVLSERLSIGTKEAVAPATKIIGDAMSPAFRSALTAVEGQVVLASCDAGQLSVESPELGHGIFTYFLLKGLHGEAEADTRRFITLGALSDYLEKSVPDWVVRNKPELRRDKAQRPWFKGPMNAREIPLAVAPITP